MLSSLALLPTLATAASVAVAVDKPADSMTLATFGPAHPKTSYKWFEQNDPVMGGQSFGNWSVVDDYGLFQGTVKNVSFLHAPGFCRATSTVIGFHDVSAYVNGGLTITYRTATPGYKGFKLAFSNVGTPTHHGGHEAEGSYKASFQPSAGVDAADSQTSFIPFNQMSWDWSDGTGECSTKDPDGYQHKCCSAANPEVCPTAKGLSAVDGFAIWAEGAEGEFQLEVMSIAAVSTPPAPSAPTCTTAEYCCPDAKHCLTPSKTSCESDPNTCATGDVCCPLTKLCVAVGNPCTPPPVCAADEYCCPDAKHCLFPVSPGKFCTGPGTQGSCATGQVCCPLTNECVTVGPACVAP